VQWNHCKWEKEECSKYAQSRSAYKLVVCQLEGEVITVNFFQAVLTLLSLSFYLYFFLSVCNAYIFNNLLILPIEQEIQSSTGTEDSFTFSTAVLKYTILPEQWMPYDILILSNYFR